MVAASGLALVVVPVVVVPAVVVPAVVVPVVVVAVVAGGGAVSCAAVTTVVVAVAVVVVVVVVVAGAGGTSCFGFGHAAYDGRLSPRVTRFRSSPTATGTATQLRPCRRQRMVRVGAGQPPAGTGTSVLRTCVAATRSFTQRSPDFLQRTTFVARTACIVPPVCARARDVPKPVAISPVAAAAATKRLDFRRTR